MLRINLFGHKRIYHEMWKGFTNLSLGSLFGITRRTCVNVQLIIAHISAHKLNRQSKIFHERTGQIYANPSFPLLVIKSICQLNVSAKTQK